MNNFSGWMMGIKNKFSRFRKIIFLYIIYDAALILAYEIIKPNILVWLFDDAFTRATGLLHYIDFRPGYPPLGKLLYTLIYNLFTGSLREILLIIINIVPLNIVIYVLYNLLKDLLPSSNAKVLTLIFALNPGILFTSIYSLHADFITLLFFLVGIYALIKGKAMMTGVLCGLGFLAKIYPLLLLLPSTIIFYRKGKALETLSAFLATTLIISAPFLALDPLMYISVFIHHMSRGPSESIFALLDGYYSHTGFLHPTYEAAIYTHQFDLLYSPSKLDHFKYLWSKPYLKYISLLLQALSLFCFSFIALRAKERAEMTALISTALLSYFAFSSFWNPLIAIPTFLLTILATVQVDIKRQVPLLVGLSCIDTYHHLIWGTSAQIISLEFSLIMVVSLRAILLGMVFLLSSLKFER